jgi:hypothetical protein
VGIFKRYKDVHPDMKIFQLLTFQGTADLLYPSVVKMHRELRELGREVVEEELVVVCNLSSHLHVSRLKAD